ncbi:MAG: type III toxin-antitoxin system ToxN/AbiQ family toxin [Oscillospiraceae bacterium]|nr:type III toxin-antitoxin system ToxN/AbiQ family toxin [Oscillospiraceae bacterium]
MERIKFYTIEDEYIRYLYKFDKKVPFNKGARRPYIGIILEINKHTYFAPLNSPKPAHNKYDENATHMKILDGKTILGIIRFNNMLPIDKKLLTYISFNDIKDYRYRKLLSKENRFIQKHTEEIRKKANQLYKIVTVEKREFFVSISCDFKLLEQKCRKYKN